MEEAVEFPELFGAGKSESIESTGAQEEGEFDRIRTDAAMEIGQGVERCFGASLLPTLDGGDGKIFDQMQRDTDGGGSARDGIKMVATSVDIGREKLDAVQAGFDGVGDAGVETFAMAENGGEKVGGIMIFEECRLVGFETVGGGMGAAKSVALKGCDDFPDGFDFGGGTVLPLGAGDKFAVQEVDLG